MKVYAREWLNHYGIASMKNDIEDIRTRSPRKEVDIPIAVPRKFKKDREKETDFFNCLFFDQAAKYLCQYAKKGGRIYVRGKNIFISLVKIYF